MICCAIIEKINSKIEELRFGQIEKSHEFKNFVKSPLGDLGASQF